MKRLKTAAMRPRQGLDLAKKHIQAQTKRKQGYIIVACGRMGPPGCGNKRAGGKTVCGRCRSEYAHGQ